jgi:glycosyltransferase involved in cell wall biosynthesis
MRFHILSLPHTVTRKDYSACAFTQKVLKMCKMMTERGHTVYHYGHKDSEVECTEHIPVTFDEDLQIAYGSYDWRKEFFKHNTSDHAHQIFNKRAIVEVGKRKQKNDFLLCFWGFAHEPIANAHPDLIAIEPGIGCTNKPFTKQSIFESYAVMNVVYGKYDRSPHWYDAVIPNYFDPIDFDFNPTPKDYFLFVGRIIDSKGVGIAIDVTKRLGVRLLVAGQGDLKSIRNPIPDHVTVIGYVEPRERCEIMRNAKALLAPTHFNEPFGGVTIEALFCGTPTITTDWGGFAENNLHGITGYRCRTIEQFVWAGKNIDKISREACREWAIKNFSLDRIALMYEEHFNTVLKVYDGSGGFYCPNDDRKELDWLSRYYPSTS